MKLHEYIKISPMAGKFKKVNYTHQLFTMLLMGRKICQL